MGERVTHLQFVDDCTMLAPDKVQMVELFRRYENFCSKLRVPVNWDKCAVTVFRKKPVPTQEQKTAERAAKAASVAALAALPRGKAKAVMRARARKANLSAPPTSPPLKEWRSGRKGTAES